MKRILILLALVGSVALVHAGSVTEVERKVQSIRNGLDNGDQIRTLRVQEDGTVGGDLDVVGTFSAGDLSADDDLTVPDDADIGGDADVVGALTAGTVGSDGDATVGGDLGVSSNATISGDAEIGQDLLVSGMRKSTPTALVVTNGQAVTVSEQWYLVRPEGGAAGTTNTITLADPGADLVGAVVKLQVSASVTNALGLADSGNLKLEGAFVGGEYDTLILGAPDASTWVEDSRSNP